MGDSWHKARLGDLAEIFDGPHATPKKSASGPIFLGISNLADGRIDLTGAEHLSEDDFVRWTRRVSPSPSDVVFSYETRLGEAALIPMGLRCCLGRRMGLLRARRDRIDPRFLLYAYLSPAFQETLRQRTVHGSTVDRIPLIDMSDFPVNVPGLAIQRAIAHILGTLDDKIELDNRTNETLEAVARALFTSWFVDFDPTRAKIAGRPPKAMDAETARLFPDAISGNLPMGWQNEALGSLVSITRGRAYTSEQLADSAVALVTLKSFLRGGGYRPDGLKPFVGTYHPEQVVREGEIVVAFTDVTQAAEVIGRPAIVELDRNYSSLVASQDLSILRPIGERIGSSFLYCLLRSEGYVSHVLGHTNGSTVLHLAKEGIPSFLVALPPIELRRTFEKVVNPLFARARLNRAHTRDLTAIRASILPRLLSGELTVQGAERAIETTA